MISVSARTATSINKSGFPSSIEFSHMKIGIMNLNFFHAAFATLFATSSAWLSPASVSKRFIQQLAIGTTADTGSYFLRHHNTKTTMEPKITTLQSAVSSTIDNECEGAFGRPIAKGSIVNTFRSGLVAVRIDDDLTNIAAKIDYDVGDLPEVVDTTQSLPNVTKAVKSTSPNALGGDLIGRQVIFENGQTGVVVVHRPPMVFVYKDSMHNDNNNDCLESSIEGIVTVLDNFFTINVPSNLQRVDCFGRNTAPSSAAKDNISTTAKSPMRSIFSPIPKVNEIALINKPLVTGVTMFDAVVPIGKGQNMLFIGHDVEDMRRYVMDMISIQKSKEIKCVYASTGDEENQKQLKTIMDSAGLNQDDVILVSSNDNKDDASNAVEAILTAATACAIGEVFAIEEGMDTFVIVDNIDLHKKFWDVTTRSLVDVFGVDSVVKADRDGGSSSEMRAFFSSLVQRSAQFDAKRGGGSVTLLLLQTIPKISDGKDESDLVFSPDDFERSSIKIKERLEMLVQKNIPLTASNLRKIQIPVPSAEEGRRRLALQHVDELISMTDGQIWLDERLEDSGRSPAMDFQRSVTRIGIGADTVSRADSAAMRRVAEGLRLDLSQAESMDGVDLETTASKKQMRNLQAWLLAMHQPPASGARKLSESCVVLLAASSGALNDIIDSGVLAGSDEGTQLMRGILDHVNKSIPDCLNEIDSTLDLTDKTKGNIEEEIRKFIDET